LSSLTKIFIVLQLVCSLVVAVLIVSLVGKQQPLQRNLDAEIVKTNAAQAWAQKEHNEVMRLQSEASDSSAAALKAAGALQQQIDQLRAQLATAKSDKDTSDAKNMQLQAALNQSAAAVDSLTKQVAAMNDENRRLGPENVSLIQKNAELNRANNELQTSLRFAEQSIRKLQEQLATAPEGPKGGSAAPGNEANTVATLTNQAPAQINGKVTAVTPTAGRTLLQLPLGTRDGVKVGTRFMVYREPGGYIADAVVERVAPDEAVAAVDTKTVKKGESVKSGDMVISGAVK